MILLQDLIGGVQLCLPPWLVLPAQIVPSDDREPSGAALVVQEKSSEQKEGRKNKEFSG